MWREIANALKELLLLRENTKKNADDIQEMQKDFKALTAFVGVSLMKCAAIATTRRTSAKTWHCACKTNC